MIPKEWLNKKGGGAVVGVCDTGLNLSLPCFEKKKILFKEFGISSPRHGTHVATTIFGIAPHCEMIFAGGVMDSYAKLEQMLLWITEFKIDVLNLSLAFPEKDEAISKLLQSMKNTIIVSAHSNKYPFPWSEKDVLSAGNGGDFKAPQEWISMSSAGYRTIMKGSSVATAITSGLCALGKAVNPSLNKEEFLKIAEPGDIPKNKPKKRQVNLNL